MLDDFSPNLRFGEKKEERLSDKAANISHDTVRELAALKDCSGHENIVQLLDVFRVKGSGKLLVSLKCEEGGTLANVLSAKKKIVHKWANSRGQITK